MHIAKKYEYEMFSLRLDRRHHHLRVDGELRPRGDRPVPGSKRSNRSRPVELQGRQSDLQPEVRALRYHRRNSAPVSGRVSGGGRVYGHDHRELSDRGRRIVRLQHGDVYRLVLPLSKSDFSTATATF